MKAFKHFLLLQVLILSLSSLGLAQQYTLRDQAEIAYQAQLTLNMYKDLLNVISYENLATQSEIKELIRNSYSKSGTQLFYSEAAIIEDNIKPSNLSSGHVQDKTVKNYLHYFDLAYGKSARETVDFFDFEPSTLKYRQYLYIQVKYTCLFKGKHKKDTASYQAADRLAEFRVEKQGNKWKTFITSIVFYDPTNPLSSAEGDVKLDTSVKDQGTFSHLTEQLNKRSGQSFRDKNKAEEPSAEIKEQDSVFNHYLKTGEAALAAEKLDRAFAAFSEAEKIYPAHQELRRNLMELAKAQNLQIRSVEKRFEHAKLEADKAYAAREYVTAKNLYAEALRLKPEEEELQGLIEKLGRTIQKNAVLESKYAVGKYKEAIKDYTRAIQEEDGNADYYYGRGRSYEKLNNIKKAIRDYTTAMELDGNFMEALSSRARLYTETGQFHQAVADYTLMLSNPDYEAVAYPQRARVKKRMGDLKGAIQDYHAAIQLNPAVADYSFEKGVILLNQNKEAEAISSFSEAIKKDYQHVGAFYQRGLAYAALKKILAASSDFNRARELGLEEGQQAELHKLSVTHYSMGEEAMEKNEFQKAVESFNDALLISPAFGKAWLRKGDGYYALQEYDKAIQSYEKAVKHDSISTAIFKRGLAYQQKKDKLSATHDFERYIPIGREIVARAEEAEGGKKRIPFLSDGSTEEKADAWYALGYAQLMVQEFADALESLDRAIDNRKFFPKAFFARGEALYALADYKRAVKNMEESIRQGLSEPAVFYMLGTAYVANKQLEDAIYSYSHALKLAPNYEAAYRQRAICYKNLGEYGLALKDIKAAIGLNETLAEDAALLTQKGLLELAQDMTLEARQSFEQALRLDENHGWALYGKACALAKDRKMEESLEWYRKAFQTGHIKWAAIRNDPLIKPASKHKAFKQLVKRYL